MIIATLAAVALTPSPVMDRPTPPPYAVHSASATAWDHYNRDLERYWVLRHNAQDTERLRGDHA